MSGALDYERAVAYVTGAKRFGMHPSLDGITALTEALGRPQDSLNAIQVAGTNGKTSVARMIAALLTAHGHRTGVFTSPHLTAYTEQIAVDGVDISGEDFARVVSEVREAASTLGEPTEFEMVCAAALTAFRGARVGWAVLEVGMGGRWDATSVVDPPQVAVITGIGLDHAEHLGDTLEEIAGEKACIIGKRSAVVLGPGTADVREVFHERAREMGVPVSDVGDRPISCEVTFDVTGRPSAPGSPTVFSVRSGHATYTELEVIAPSYQAGNAATAVAATEAALGGTLDAGITSLALQKMRFPGRFEVVGHDPYVVLDAAHNPQAAGVLAGAVAETLVGDPPVMVLGVLEGKDVRGIVAALAPVSSRFVATQSGSDRALSAQAVADAVEEVTGVRPPSVPSVAGAIARAREAGVSIVVTGSLTVAGEARDVLCALQYESSGLRRVSWESADGD